MFPLLLHAHTSACGGNYDKATVTVTIIVLDALPKLQWVERSGFRKDHTCRYIHTYICASKRAPWLLRLSHCKYNGFRFVGERVPKTCVVVHYRPTVITLGWVDTNCDRVATTTVRFSFYCTCFFICRASCFFK